MPNSQILEQKKQVVASITETFKASAAGVLIDYRGLSVAEDTELRNKFREAGVTYTVIKNTLTRFAAKEVGFDELDDVLHGPTSLATSETDVIAPAKIIAEFAKTHPVVEIKAGFVEGKIVSVDDVKALAAIPSKEILLARMLGSLMGPLTGLTVALNAIVERGDMTAVAADAPAADVPAVEDVPAEAAAPEAAPEVTDTPAVEEVVAEAAPAEATAEETPAEAAAPAEEVPAAEETADPEVEEEAPADAE